MITAIVVAYVLVGVAVVSIDRRVGDHRCHACDESHASGWPVSTMMGALWPLSIVFVLVYLVGSRRK